MPEHCATGPAYRSADFVFEGLDERGRLQFFFHSPSSSLPIRDVLNEQRSGCKTEPHIEIGAENFLNCCYQSNNIIPFLRSREKYLFLFTKCKNANLSQYNKKLIVGLKRHGAQAGHKGRYPEEYSAARHRGGRKDLQS